MLAIHRSASRHQGQPMHAEYLDETAVARYAERAETLIGALDHAGALDTYVSVQKLGEIALSSTIRWGDRLITPPPTAASPRSSIT